MAVRQVLLVDLVLHLLAADVEPDQLDDLVLVFLKLELLALLKELFKEAQTILIEFHTQVFVIFVNRLVLRVAVLESPARSMAEEVLHKANVVPAIVSVQDATVTIGLAVDELALNKNRISRVKQPANPMWQIVVNLALIGIDWSDLLAISIILVLKLFEESALAFLQLTTERQDRDGFVKMQVTDVKIVKEAEQAKLSDFVQFEVKGAQSLVRLIEDLFKAESDALPIRLHLQLLRHPPTCVRLIHQVEHALICVPHQSVLLIVPAVQIQISLRDDSILALSQVHHELIAELDGQFVKLDFEVTLANHDT